MADQLNTKILKLLSLGKSQAEISDIFKKKRIQPNSLSIIEKRINSIKKEYKCKTMFQLAIKLKDNRII